MRVVRQMNTKDARCYPRQTLRITPALSLLLCFAPAAAERTVQRDRCQRVFTPRLVQRIRILQIRFLRREYIEETARTALIKSRREAQRLIGGLQCVLQAVSLL